MKRLPAFLHKLAHLVRGRQRAQPRLRHTMPPALAARQQGGRPARMGVGSWIFVSHSNKDFNAVRRVRNALEERGHFPLLFFLKCVSDDTELDSLLRREIEARDFFLLCDTESARSSRYVQEEVSFIKSLGNKIYETVDLGADWDAQLAKIQTLSRRATVFLSFVGEDSAMADQIAATLEARDFRVLNLHGELHAGDNPFAQVHDAIHEALADGFVVILLSPASVSRAESFQWKEIRTAMELETRFAPGRSRIVPVVLHDYASVMRASEQVGLSKFSCLDLSANDPADKASNLSDVLLGLAREIT